MKGLLVTAFMLATIPMLAHADPVTITTGKQVYSYGEHLSFTVTVEEVTKNKAAFMLIDDKGVGSSTIDMEIVRKENTITSPHPFESIIFDTGTYTIRIWYDEYEASTQFVLNDLGGINIPFWMTDVANLWIDGLLDDTAFLKNFADNDIIKWEEAEQTEAYIPSWYKISIKLWTNGLISDDELVAGLQYLISANIITTGMQ